MTANNDTSLTIRNLTKSFVSSDGRITLGVDNVSFGFESGTFFTLLGPSGCGKTTTLRCIAGLEQADEGLIRLGNYTFYDSASQINVPLNKRNLGMVFQSYAIWPHMTVFENVAFPLRAANDKRYSKSEVRESVERALETVDLKGFGGRSATQLSGGQQQRVALARAIVRKPRLLLLDEPLSNLDARLRDEMRNELKRLQRQLGLTTIYVTHDQCEALELSDQIAVLNAGRLVQLGSAQDIYRRPCDAFVAGFVGSSNLLHGTISNSVSDRETSEVGLRSGQLLKCHFPKAAAGGSSIVVSIRPEVMNLNELKSQVPEGCNRMVGRVTASGYLGTAIRYTIAVGDTTVDVTTPADTNFMENEEVAIDFPISETLGLNEKSE